MKKSIIIIGIFTTSVTTLFTFFIIRASNLVGTKSYEVYAEMKDANGIVRETTVRIAGVTVGKVKNLTLKKDNHVRLTIELDGNIAIPIDSIVQKKPLGILGSSFLEIIPGTESKLISKGHTLNSTSSSSLMDTLGTSAGNISKDLESITDTVNTYLSQSKIFETINSISIELNTALVGINALLETVQASAKNNSDSINGIITATAQITNALEYLMVKDKNSSDTELSQTLLAIRNTLVNIEEITGKINNGEGTIGKLVYKDDVYDTINEVANNLDTTINSINNIVTPTSQLKTAFDYRVENLISENFKYTPKQHVNILLKVPNTQRQFKVGITYGGGEVLSSKRNSYPSLSNSNIKLNLTIGQNLFKDYFTLHGGIIENTGGLKLDIKPLKEWIISSEIYNFGTKNGVNIRTLTQINPFTSLENTNNPLRWLYINGGVDDILNNYTRTYFIGVGLHFVDNFFYDATKLLPVASTINTIP